MLIRDKLDISKSKKINYFFKTFFLFVLMVFILTILYYLSEWSQKKFQNVKSDFYFYQIYIINGIFFGPRSFRHIYITINKFCYSLFFVLNKNSIIFCSIFDLDIGISIYIYIYIYRCFHARQSATYFLTSSMIDISDYIGKAEKKSFFCDPLPLSL